VGYKKGPGKICHVSLEKSWKSPGFFGQ